MHFLLLAVLLWTDPQTRLVWAPSDSGAGVSRLQAQRFCEAATYGGFRDWRLPRIEELEAIYGGDDHDGRRVKGSLKLTGWEWSSSPGEDEGESWALDFGDGGRASVAWGDSGLNRALCVRGPTAP